jgi:hypothetical protein
VFDVLVRFRLSRYLLAKLPVLLRKTGIFFFELHDAVLQSYHLGLKRRGQILAGCFRSRVDRRAFAQGVKVTQVGEQGPQTFNSGEHLRHGHTPPGPVPRADSDREGKLP